MTAVTPGSAELLARWLEAEAEKYSGETAIYSAGHVGNILKSFAPRVRLAAKPADEPDFIYDPDDWEWTSEYKSRNDLAESAGVERGDVKRFCTLINGPDKFCALVPTDRPDDAGDHHEWEYRWFDSEAEARTLSPTGKPKP